MNLKDQKQKSKNKLTNIPKNSNSESLKRVIYNYDDVTPSINRISQPSDNFFQFKNQDSPIRNNPTFESIGSKNRIRNNKSKKQINN